MNGYQYSAVIIDSIIIDLFNIILNNFYSKLDDDDIKTNINDIIKFGSVYN